MVGALVGISFGVLCAVLAWRAFVSFKKSAGEDGKLIETGERECCWDSVEYMRVCKAAHEASR